MIDSVQGPHSSKYSLNQRYIRHSIYTATFMILHCFTYSVLQTLRHFGSGTCFTSITAWDFGHLRSSKTYAYIPFLVLQMYTARFLECGWLGFSIVKSTKVSKILSFLLFFSVSFLSFFFIFLVGGGGHSACKSS